jgi:hypothetical protein
MSTELTSSGSVNVTTKSRTNSYHGESFGQFRDGAIGAPLPTPPGINAPYQRSQYGGDLVGPIFRDKLFFFADGERTIQHTNAPVAVSVPFSQYSGTFSDPFHEGNLLGRVDYQGLGRLGAKRGYQRVQCGFAALIAGLPRSPQNLQRR